MATGVQLTELQRLNPALKLGRTAPDGPNHVLVPAGTGQRIGKKIDRVQIMPAMASLASLRTSTYRPAALTERSKTHVVKGGENLASIARAYGIDARALAASNGLSVRETLLTGQSLRIETGGDSRMITHLVAQGDSIKGLARRYGVSVKDIQRWNRLADRRLNPGDLILIYPIGGSAPTS
jgi:membrane-bound lytic murein transglycosylase D